MSNFLKFNIVQIVPDPLRGEAMNVGIVLHTESGPKLELSLIPSRLKALDPSWGGPEIVDHIESWTTALEQFDNPELKWNWLKNAMAPLVVTEGQGTIYFQNDEQLKEKTSEIIKRMVLPLKGKRVRVKKAKRFDLNAQITAWLKQQHIFSRNMTDLAKNRVVSGFPLNVEEDMFAEFALKNGAVHVLETLDFRGHHSYTKTLRNEASHKAMVLDVAIERLETQSQRLALVTADDYGEMKPALTLLNRKATALLSMESSQDRQWLADFVAKSLHLPSLFLPEPMEQEGMPNPALHI